MVQGKIAADAQSSWIACFREYRDRIEKEPCDSDLRAEIVREATKTLLPSSGSPPPFQDYASLLFCANNLETELAKYAKGTPEKKALLSRTRRAERALLFIGGGFEILHQYRDGGMAFVLEERDRLLRRLERGHRLVRGAVFSMNQYLIVEQSFDPDQMQRIDNTLAEIEALQQLYEHTLAPDANDTDRSKYLKTQLKNDYHRVKRQYLAAIMRLTFQQYGNITRAVESTLLQLKDVDDLDSKNGNDGDSQVSTDSDRVYTSRARTLALDGLLKRAQNRNWPCLPILEAYIRSIDKRRPRNADNA